MEKFQSVCPYLKFVIPGMTYLNIILFMWYSTFSQLFKVALFPNICRLAIENSITKKFMYIYELSWNLLSWSNINVESYGFELKQIVVFPSKEEFFPVRGNGEGGRRQNNTI